MEGESNPTDEITVPALGFFIDSDGAIRVTRHNLTDQDEFLLASFAEKFGRRVSGEKEAKLAANSLS